MPRPESTQGKTPDHTLTDLVRQFELDVKESGSVPAVHQQFGDGQSRPAVRISQAAGIAMLARHRGRAADRREDEQQSTRCRAAPPAALAAPPGGQAGPARLAAASESFFTRARVRARLAELCRQVRPIAGALAAAPAAVTRVPATSLISGSVGSISGRSLPWGGRSACRPWLGSQRPCRWRAGTTRRVPVSGGWPRAAVRHRYPAGSGSERDGLVSSPRMS